MLRQRIERAIRAYDLVPDTRRGWALMGLCVLYAAAVVTALLGLTTASVAVVLAVNAGAAALVGWQRYWSVDGLVPPWRRLGTWPGVVTVLLFLLLYPVPAILLWRTSRRAMQARHAQLEQRPHDIARLEHDLKLDDQASPTPGSAE
jgi:hypothetical protein